MTDLMRRGWVLLPILASLGTQCDTAPRGVPPAPITRIEVVLRSVAAPGGNPEVAACLARMDDLANHIRPSWRGNQPVLLTETAPAVFRAEFLDVPIGILNTMTVHDRNECARDPQGDGRVTMGVTVNGTPITRVVGTKTLAFELDEQGMVVGQPAPGSP